MDWTTPANTHLDHSANLAAGRLHPTCAATARTACPSRAPRQKLDGLGDRLMFRLAYRNFGDHEALVFNHTVNASGGQAGVRWYEIRNPSSTATHLPAGHLCPRHAPTAGWAAWRWTAAATSAVGYSVSSSTVFPASATPGAWRPTRSAHLPQGEATLFAGTGSQTDSVNRWGDYSDMTVDPSDDCTFWYTNEYYTTTGASAGSTRIGSFKFPQCSGGPPPTPTNTPVVAADQHADPHADQHPQVHGPTNTPTRDPDPHPDARRADQHRHPHPDQHPHAQLSGGCSEAMTNGGFESGTTPVGGQTSANGYQLV